MRYRILPYKPGSQSARTLSNALGGLRLRSEGRDFRSRTGDVLINWGSSVRPERFDGVKLLNPPEVIERVSDKLVFFNRMGAWEPDLIPKFWTDPDQIPEDKFPIVCRTVLNGHSGQGIVIANSRTELVSAPLYTKYVKKDQEYRIHCSPHRLISVQRKARSRAVADDDVNWMVRNHANGFIFARNNVEPPKPVLHAALRAMNVSGLDFGAVDVIYKEKKDRAWVLEINSAPGLEGSTVNDYVRFFQEVNA